MENTGYTRKLDSTGRLVIPGKLRDQMGLEIGKEYTFFTHEDKTGRKFICIECPGVNAKVLEEARRIISRYGVKLPDT